MPPVPSPAISSSLFFLVPLLLLVLAFQPSSTPRPSMVPAQLIQTLIAILAVLVATLGLAGLYKAEMVVEALFVFVLQSTVVYIIISLSSFSQYAIALIVLLSSATLFSFLSILVHLPAVLNYLPPILFVSFCLVTFKIIFQLIFPNHPRRPISLPKAEQLYGISLDAVESGVPPPQDNPLKTILLVSFSSQFLFLLFCILRLSSLPFLYQDTAKQWALKTVQMIFLILSSLCSTYVFSQYACHQGLQYGDQRRLRLAAGPSGAFKTVNGLCSTSSGAYGTSDAYDASAAVDVSGSLEASKASIISDASINSTVSIASDASDTDKRAYTNINSYSKHDNDNDSATLSSSPSVSVPGSLSPQSRWSRFIALASRPTTSMASLAPSAATDTAATSEVCTRVNSRFTLDIGRSSTFPSSIPSIPSISSSRSTTPSIHSIDSNPSVFGSISTLYTLPNDALSSMHTTTSATGVTGASPVMITATPFLHPVTAMLSNSQNSHYMTTLADTYGMTADYGLVEYADEGGSREASFPDQSLCPHSRGLNPHITYSTNQDRVLASDASLDAVVTATPLLHPATTTFQTSQDKTILSYKHDMTANYAVNVASYGTVRYTDEGVSRGAPIPDQTSCPLSRGLAPHLTCLTNQNRVLASDVSLNAAATTTTLDFDSGRAHLIGHKESMHSLTSFSSTSSSSSSSTTTLGISTTTSMQSMHERAVSWSSSSIALPGSGRRNVAMKMKMTGGVPLGKCVPLDVLSRNFLQDEDEVGTESPASLTPDSEFSPRLDDSEYSGSKRTKSRGSWGRSMSAAAAFEVDNAAYNLPDVAEENVKKKSHSGSVFLFGGWGRLGGVREDDHTQDQKQEQGQGRSHRRQRSRGLSLSIGRVMKGRSLSLSLLSGWMKSRPKKDEDDDDETQRVLGGDSMPSSETPSLFSGSGWGSGSPMFSSLSLTGMTGSKAAINTSRSTLVTTSSGTTPNASPSSTPTSQSKKAGWKTIQGKKSCSMMTDDTHHRPADFMDMRDPFAPPVLGLRARTSPSSLTTPPSPHSSPSSTRVGGSGRTKGRGRERERNVSCPSPCPTTPTPGSALDISGAQQQHEGLLDVEEALLTQRLLMRLDLSPSPF